MTKSRAIAFYGSILVVMVPTAAPRRFDAAVVIVAALVFSQAAPRRVFARGRTAIETMMGWS